MFCNHCGKKVEDGVRFCPACGNKLHIQETMNLWKETLLFESKGNKVSKARKNMLIKLGWFCSIFGILVTALVGKMCLDFDSRYGDDEVYALFAMVTFVGICMAFAGICFLIKGKGGVKDVGYVSIYTSYIEVYDKFRKQAIDLKWDEIYAVNKKTEYMLFLQTEKGDFSVEIDDVNKVQHIIEGKLQERK